MCHHVEAATELDVEEREEVLEHHTEAELEEERSEEEREALAA